MRVEYEAKTSNTVTRSIYSLYIHSDREQGEDLRLQHRLQSYEKGR